MTAHEIRSGALRLAIEERAELAAELLASLDGPPDADVERAWATEIERRILRARSGAGRAREWEAVRDELLGKGRPS